MKRILSSVLVLVLFFAHTIYARLSLELTRGMSAAMPIALVPFVNGDSVKVPGDSTITSVIHNDLEDSGQFRVVEPSLFASRPSKVSEVDFQHWQKLGVNNLVMGEVTALSDGRYQVDFKLLNVYTPKTPVMMGERFDTTEAGLRALSHHISDLIYQKLTGIPGVFSTKIAYVLVQHPVDALAQYNLEVADADGFNPQRLLSSPQPIMSPTWMPDGRELAYVSFEHHEASIYLQDVATGSRRLVSRFPGINGAPAFSPDGKRLAMVLSMTGNPKIYVFSMLTHRLTQITHGYSIDTEPAWAPDGKSMIFTSDRGGTPQIYRYYFAGDRIERLTFDGNYNARASFVPHQNAIVLMHRSSDLFGIAKQNLNTGYLTSLTDSGSDESPSVAPNGRMILYAQNYKGSGVLALVSIDGRIKLRLPSREGNVQEPAWSPFLHS